MCIRDSRTTGQSHPDQVPVELQLVMTDTTLFAGRPIPADIIGYGPLPAGMARYLLATLNPETAIWLRRLYTDPRTGQLIAMESKRRHFPTPLRRFFLARDQLCRTPWCGAPIRHADHVQPPVSYTHLDVYKRQLPFR